mmetsp:Transcript_123992/g.246900  ORF Transcript_123992/g.246900 Transcript_123992/m.246900 type:complete len:364 (+) Transcript_123992:99-1190(+)|eukprot:CAMPEP_0172736444 /NCGR_PEP_ID=MMETSP1074-20121228/115076_1 /TAXON_ID=2916 /ORGANISM="Ceratium fusus, Strain PA161109" /LENGTH=363 /DNA_ID=CAMNT_0013565649 /DNA_START=41 /DNA_END=1132 /DNA_ORIENTATION=-
MDSDKAATPPPKRPRFSIEPDVEVEVEDEVFRVHSYVLMSQSSVFHQMLSSGMREASTGRISLAGKSKAEFQEFLCHLQNPGCGVAPEIEPSVAKWLVGWADEYQVTPLKKRCEETLVENSRHGSKDWDNLELSTKFNLENLRKASLLNIGRDIFPHRNRLLEILKQPYWGDSDDEEHDDSGKATEGKEGGIGTGSAAENLDGEDENEEMHPHFLFMVLILPRLYQAVFLDKPKFDELPDALSFEHLWPIVVRALELADGWSDLEEANRAARRAATIEKEVRKVLPINCRLFQQERVTGRDIHSQCKDATASSQLQVNEVVQALDRRGGITKVGPHFFQNCDKLRINKRREAAASEAAGVDVC